MEISVTTTFIICIFLGLIFSTHHIGDNLNIRKKLKKDKLDLFDTAWVIILSIFTLGFSTWGFIHFHGKDLKQSLQEFKKLKLYKNFLWSHLAFLFLILTISPEIVWEIVGGSYSLLGSTFVILFPFSLIMATLSFIGQLPNFFDRHSIIVVNESHRWKD